MKIQSFRQRAYKSLINRVLNNCGNDLYVDRHANIKIKIIIYFKKS
jgi:hypothetical protein